MTLRRVELQVLTWPVEGDCNEQQRFRAWGRGLEYERAEELYTGRGDGWRLKWGTLTETMSRGSEAIYLGIVALLIVFVRG